jgi:hypothetical protein
MGLDRTTITITQKEKIEMTLSPTEINSIMEMDPLSLTRDGPEIAALIAIYRERRTQYKTGERVAKAKVEKKLLSLDDLGDLTL